MDFEGITVIPCAPGRGHMTFPGLEDQHPILDVAKARLGRTPGDTSPMTGADFERVNLSILGGCAWCAASLAAYNAYPTHVGFWSCADCLGDDGFETVEAFEAFV